MKINSSIALLTCLILGACATNNSNQFHWGGYESVLYDMYHKPGKATPELQIAIIGADVDAALGVNKAIPPGVYAHLGTMYAAAGNIGDAIASFERERQLYPESKVLIDGMIARAKSEAGQ